MARVGATAVAMLVLAACAGPGAGNGGEARTGRLDVGAAASLTGVFDEIGRRFEAEHPGASVSFSFGASSTLASQVRGGAPLDVVATAEAQVLDDLAGEGLVAAPRPFARNRLALLVRAGNPHGIGALADLGRRGIDVVLCAREVPCGRLAAQVLGSAGVEVTPRSYEPNVRAVVSRVVQGEADAGLVYATDARAAGPRSQAVPIPDAANASTVYALSRVRASGAGSLADAFVAFVASRPASDLLAAAGFEAP